MNNSVFHLALLLPFTLGCFALEAQAQPAPAAGQDSANSADKTNESAEAKLKPESPAVAALRNTTSNAPRVLLKNLFTLLDLDAPQAARPLLAKLAAAELSAEQQAALAREFGTGRLLELMREESLAPEGKQFARSLFDASAAAARDPAKLNQFISQLEYPKLARQSAAELRRAGQDGAVFCLAALADPNQAKHHDSLASVLATFGDLGEGPLLAAIETNDPDFRARVISSLTQLAALRKKRLGHPNVGRAVPQLLADALDSDIAAPTTVAARRALQAIFGETPTQAEAETLLSREIRRALKHGPALPIDYTGQVKTWNWDDRSRKATTVKRSPHEAGALVAARLAHDLAELAPGDSRYRKLFLLAALASDKMQVGYDEPLPMGSHTARSLAEQFTPTELATVLGESLKANRQGAAIGALELISEKGDASLLATAHGDPSPIVDALELGDRRVRFAALQTIMRLDPRSGFPGASRVPIALGYFAHTSGAPFAALGDSRSARATSVAALLIAAGVEVQIANNGFDLVALTAQSADVEMVFIDMKIHRPAIRETLYRLRKQAATSKLPFALIASAGKMADARRLADADPLTLATIRPQDEASAARLLEKLRALNPREAIPSEQRQSQATQALAWLNELSSRKENFYDLASQTEAVEMTLGVRGMAKHAAPVVAALGRPSGQRALVRLAGRPIATEEDRRAAANAFRQAVERHGLLLTRQEIAQQYKLYNASETSDPATQQILSSLLDAIEKKTDSPKQAKSE